MLPSISPILYVHATHFKNCLTTENRRIHHCSQMKTIFYQSCKFVFYRTVHRFVNYIFSIRLFLCSYWQIDLINFVIVLDYIGGWSFSKDNINFFTDIFCITPFTINVTWFLAIGICSLKL